MGYDDRRDARCALREATVNLHKPWLAMCAALMGLAASAPLLATAVGKAQVRLVTGSEELTAGSLVELRIYEAGKAVRHVPLTHGESWPRDSTLTIPVTFPEPLDPRTVTRFGVYYRAASPLSPPWEVISVEVDLPPGQGSPDRLLNTTLTGVMAREGELATDERSAVAMICFDDTDCDDHRKCNGRERCAPRSAGADARGCVKGSPVVCPVNQVCTEERGCRGLDVASPPAPPPAAAAPK